MAPNAFSTFCLQAHLEIQVPTYYAGNDPLLTYATPLHPQEEHTTTREELIGKVTNPETDYAAYTAGNGNGNDDTIEAHPVFQICYSLLCDTIVFISICFY